MFDDISKSGMSKIKQFLMISRPVINDAKRIVDIKQSYLSLLFPHSFKW